MTVTTVINTSLLFTGLNSFGYSVSESVWLALLSAQIIINATGIYYVVRQRQQTDSELRMANQARASRAFYAGFGLALVLFAWRNIQVGVHRGAMAAFLSVLKGLLMFFCMGFFLRFAMTHNRRKQ